MSKEWDLLHITTMPTIALRGLTVFPNVMIHFDDRLIPAKDMDTSKDPIRNYTEN